MVRVLGKVLCPTVVGFCLLTGGSGLAARVVEKPELLFDYEDRQNADIMNMAVKVFKKADVPQNAKPLDYSNLRRLLGPEDLISVAQSALYYPDVDPKFFSRENVMTKGFLSKAFRGQKIKNVDANANLASIELSKFGFKIQSKVHFEFYSTLAEFLSTIPSRRGIAAWQEIHDRMGLPLAKVSVIRSSEEDISSGSLGTRVVNLYFESGDRGTMHVSVKVVSFKKEGVLSAFWSWLPNRIVSDQLSGTWDALAGVRKYAAGR